MGMVIGAVMLDGLDGLGLFEKFDRRQGVSEDIRKAAGRWGPS